MLKLIEGNAIIGQSGGPTAVINQSLVGVVEGLRGLKPIKKVLGMRHGVTGLMKNLPCVDLSGTPWEVLERTGPLAPRAPGVQGAHSQRRDGRRKAAPAG